MKNKIPTILVVDDDKDIVNAICTILSMENYHTQEAVTGKEALTIVENSKPDLILLDYMLPDMTGKDIVEKIRKDPQLKNLPIILISAAHGVQELGQNIAIDDWIEKPFELDLLLTKISKFL